MDEITCYFLTTHTEQSGVVANETRSQAVAKIADRTDSEHTL